LTPTAAADRRRLGQAAADQVYAEKKPTAAIGGCAGSGEHPGYDPSMSDRKARLTITVDPHLSAYAEQLVEAGRAPSVSAVFNDALADRVERDKRIRRRWKEAAERADDEKVARMLAHVEAQAAALREQ
jgi:Arc/MetJ-type ribon-helix-helix transcriptional regulator